MRTFLKNNALAILACLFVAGAYSSASTITRPYGPSDYAGGTKAVGAYVNAEFANIVSWLNGGNIGPTNIATSGVATSNIAAFAVTSAKIADSNVTTAKIADRAVTYDKLPLLNLSITGSSSLYSLANTVTPATVTNLSTTITTSAGSANRAISVRLEPNLGTYLSSGVAQYTSFIMPFGANAGTAGSSLFFVRDGSTTAHWQVFSGSATESRPCSSFSYTDTVSPSTTYTIALKVSNGDASATGLYVVNCRLVVEEL